MATGRRLPAISYKKECAWLVCWENMKTFRCPACANLLFFENVRCERCGSRLGFAPEPRAMIAFDEAWTQTAEPAAVTGRWRPCNNYRVENVCNWLVHADDPNPLCRCCRYTAIIPALHKPQNRGYWYLLEAAKRRLFYSLLDLGLPIPSRADDPEGLEFHFLEDTDDKRALTGHASGVITLNIVEADDVAREQRRTNLHEPYRTLLGHFRHESGHFYWDRLIRDSRWLAEFRTLFGDEREDYAAALERHYATSPAERLGWEARFISAYAAAHPWEDWAESWAHYLHVTDALDTARDWGIVIDDSRTVVREDAGQVGSFREALLGQWMPLTLFLNSMNSSLGQKLSYPFLLPDPVIDKLCFVDTVVKATDRPTS